MTDTEEGIQREAWTAAGSRRRNEWRIFSSRMLRESPRVMPFARMIGRECSAMPYVSQSSTPTLNREHEQRQILRAAATPGLYDLRNEGNGRKGAGQGTYDIEPGHEYSASLREYRQSRTRWDYPCRSGLSCSSWVCPRMRYLIVSRIAGKPVPAGGCVMAIHYRRETEYLAMPAASRSVSRLGHPFQLD